jgi:long-chain fatty acid transport protein
MELSDGVAVGGGLFALYADAELSRAVFVGPGRSEGKVLVEGDDTGFGFTLGAMFSPNDSTRIGIGFRSKTKIEVDGTRTVSGTRIADGNVGASAAVDLPETVYVSGAHALSERFSILGSVRWTNWSRFDELRIEFDGPFPDDVTPEQWDDSVTASVGGAYSLASGWVLRAGVAFDESPVPSDDLRTPRIPDSDRIWLTLGATYQARANVSIDFGYAHLFGDDPSMVSTINLVSRAPGAFADTLRGTYEDSDADLFGVQVRWLF